MSYSPDKNLNINFTSYYNKSNRNSFLDLTKVHRKESNNDLSNYDRRSNLSSKRISRKSLINLGYGYGNSYAQFDHDHSAMNRIVIGSRMTVNDHNTSLYAKKAKLFAAYPFLTAVYDQASLEELKLVFMRLQFTLFFIDLFCFIADLTVVTWSYFLHFEYNKHNYCSNDSDNIQRFICLGITVLVMVTLVLRNITRRHFQNAKYLLSLRATVPSQRLQYEQLTIEIIMHVIQPYPYVCANFGMIILGIPVIYSLDMIFFSLSILRLYVLVKVLKNWNVYTNSRGYSITKFFGNTNMIMFLYKICLKHYGSLTLAIIFFGIGLIGGYVFKVYENYQPYESGSVFGDLWICVWFIAQTMTNGKSYPLYDQLVGYGDYVPVTLVGRFITIFLCFIGIFIESLFIVTIILFVTFTEESEQRAYEEINLIHTKGRETNLYNFYFRSLLSSKLTKLLPKKNQSIKDTLKAKSSMKMLKEKYYLRVFSSASIPVTVTDFTAAVKQTLDPEFDYCIEWQKERNDVIKPYIDFFCDNILDYRTDVFNCISSNNQMVNLALLIYWCGMSYPLIEQKMLKKDMVVNRKGFDMKKKEFHVLFKEKMIKDESQMMKRKSINSSNNGIDTLTMMSFDDNNNNNEEENDEPLNDEESLLSMSMSMSMSMSINGTDTYNEENKDSKINDDD